MLIIGAKFAEIVKVSETIEDGLRTEKISHVVAAFGSLGLLEKREKMCLFYYEGKKIQGDHHHI